MAAGQPTLKEQLENLAKLTGAQQAAANKAALDATPLPTQSLPPIIVLPTAKA